MKLLSILALLLAVSCSSSKSTGCKADTDCSSNQVCNATAGSCIAQTTAHCKTNDACGAQGTCDQTKKQCTCGSNPDCGSGYVCSAGSCVQTCTGTGASNCTQATQTCQSGTCKAEIAANCRTNAACPVGSGLTCDVNQAICNCGGSATTSGTKCQAAQSCLSGTCQSQRRVFVTSNVFTPGTKFSAGTNCPNAAATPVVNNACTFNGPSDADAACQAVANKANLGGIWMAWLSTTQTSAIDRIVPTHIADGDVAHVYGIAQTNISDGSTLTATAFPAVKISGPVTKTGNVSGNFANACVGSATTGSDCPITHASAINWTEFGVNISSVSINDSVFTGIDKSDFVASSNANDTCTDWTMGSGSSFFYGILSKKDNTWNGINKFNGCQNSQRLYCIEVNQ